MRVTYLGHSAFKIESDGIKVFVDPWLSGPTSPIKVADVNEADLCLVTHDHGDHGSGGRIDCHRYHIPCECVLNGFRANDI